MTTSRAKIFELLAGVTLQAQPIVLRSTSSCRASA